MPAVFNTAGCRAGQHIVLDSCVRSVGEFAWHMATAHTYMTQLLVRPPNASQRSQHEQARTPQQQRAAMVRRCCFELARWP